MKHKVNDIVHGIVPVSVANILRDNNITVSFVGKVVEVDDENRKYIMSPYVCTDLYGGWHSITGTVSEAEDFIMGLCSAKQFDMFHDVSRDRNKQIPEEHYLNDLSVAIIMKMHETI